MKPVNLIPTRRILARQRQRHMRRAAVICSSWAVVIAGVCAAGQGVLPGGSAATGGNIDGQLEKVAREVEVNRQAVSTVRDELSGVQATLRATRAIANQPDWSILLALLGHATGDDVMLRSFELQPNAPVAPAVKAAPTPPGARAPQPSAPAPRSAAFVLNLGGLGQSQPAVTQFVLRLERVGLFSRVTLLDTSREPFRDGEATSFRLECVIDGSTAAPGAANSPAAATPGKATR